MDGTAIIPVAIPPKGMHGIAKVDGENPRTSGTSAWMRPIIMGSTLLTQVPRNFPKCFLSSPIFSSRSSATPARST